MLKLKNVANFKGVTSVSSSSQAPGFDWETANEITGHQSFPLYQSTSMTAWKALWENRNLTKTIFLIPGVLRKELIWI